MSYVKPSPGGIFDINELKVDQVDKRMFKDLLIFHLDFQSEWTNSYYPENAAAIAALHKFAARSDTLGEWGNPVSTTIARTQEVVIENVCVMFTNMRVEKVTVENEGGTKICTGLIADMVLVGPKSLRLIDHLSKDGRFRPSIRALCDSRERDGIMNRSIKSIVTFDLLVCPVNITYPIDDSLHTRQTEPSPNN